MQRPEYLSKYYFDWELFDVAVGGKSALDSKFFVGPMSDKDQVQKFLVGYGLNPTDMVTKSELFGIFQESLQFIRRYFLKEGNPDGLDFKIPNSLYMITEISDLFLMATGQSVKNHVDRLWAEIVLKIMHVILHVDKDLRTNYFSIIQTQIFDRFYKYVFRDQENRLFLGIKGSDDKIQLLDFQTKAKKSRDSVIIKLLTKNENVAEELFDRVGVRFVTNSSFDALRVIRFLIRNNIVIPHNIKPSRSVNSLIDVTKFRKKYWNLLKVAIRNNLSEERFLQALDRESSDCFPEEEVVLERNMERSKLYRAIQFTALQLIIYKDPFLQEFNTIKQYARDLDKKNKLAKKVLSLDTSLLARDIRFFYPFEVQIMDKESHNINTKGEASHEDYKKAKVNAAIKRVFWALIKNLDGDN